VVLGVAVLVAAASGCGGGSKGSSASSGSTVTVDESTSTVETTGGAATADADTSSAADAAGGGSDTSSSGSSSVSKSCVEFASTASKLSEAIGAGAADADPEEIRTYFDGLADKAPDEIKGSFRTLADAVGTYVSALKDAGIKAGETPTAAQAAKLQSQLATLSSAKVQAASQKISAWVAAGCHS
jgi:hypothetical protein